MPLCPRRQAAAQSGATGLISLFLVFLKLGVVVFGSGYVLVAFLQADLVDRLHWVTQPQLLDAITAGQVTPGPVFATATFLGYLLRGWAGAAVATVAIFLPSFFMAGLVGALAGRIRKSKLAAAFLDGVNAAAVALMAAVALSLGRATLVDGWTWALGSGERGAAGALPDQRHLADCWRSGVGHPAARVCLKFDQAGPLLGCHSL